MPKSGRTLRRGRTSRSARTRRRHRSHRRHGGQSVRNIPFLPGATNMTGIPIQDQNLVLRSLGSSSASYNPSNYAIVRTDSTNAEHKAAVAKTVGRLAAEKKNLRTREPLFRERANIRRSRVPAAAAAAAAAAGVLDGIFGERGEGDEDAEYDRIAHIAPRIFPVPPERQLGPGRNYESAEVIGMFQLADDGYFHPMRWFMEHYGEFLNDPRIQVKLEEEKKKQAAAVRKYRADNVKYIIEYIKTDKDYIAYHAAGNKLKYGMAEEWEPAWLLMPVSFSAQSVLLVKIKRTPGGLLNTYNETRGFDYVSRVSANNAANNAANKAARNIANISDEDLALMAYSPDELEGMQEGLHTYNDMFADIVERLLSLQVQEEELRWWVDHVSDKDKACATYDLWDTERFMSYPRKMVALITPLAKELEYVGYEHAFDDMHITLFKAKFQSKVEHCKRR